MNKKILSFGSIYLDINCSNFPFGQGLLPETETVGKEYQAELGGSAVNAAKIMAAIGLPATFIGKVGKDIFGQEVSKLLEKRGIKSALIMSPEVQTNLGLNFISSNGKNIQAVVGDANKSLTPEEVQEKIKKLIGDVEYLYLGGFFKLKKIQQVILELAQEAKEAGVKIILDHGRVTNDTSPEQIQQVKKLVTLADYYFPSEDELLAIWQAKNVEAAIQTARAQTQAVIAVKMAEKGSIGCEQNGKLIKTPAFSVKPLNTVGAGDSFNAGFIKAQTLGYDVEKSLKFANATAALKISHTKLPQTKSIKKMMD